jgi:hypothetical protein
VGYKITGEYVFNCACQLICPCAMDGPPLTKDGTCNGAGVFHISKGNLDDTDLSGVDVGMIFNLPSNSSAGNWRIGLVIDPSVAADKAAAIEDIFQGRAGGPFAGFIPLIAEFIPTGRANVAFKGGKKTSATIGKGSVDFEPIVGGDGNPTIVRNAMFGFAPEFELGKGSGGVDMSGITFESIYGEHAKFEYAS